MKFNLKNNPIRKAQDLKRGAWCVKHSARFANVNEASNVLGFVNDLQVQHDGWAMVSPYGDFPGVALTAQADGTMKKSRAIQRIDRPVAEAMVRKFKSPWGRVKRFFTGCPIYLGHPDVPGIAEEYDDKAPKGLFSDLEARTDGLYGKPVFTNEGSELVENRHLVALSPYWTARETGEEAGVKIFQPDEFKSAGLTNRPNLPVRHLMNEAALAAASATETKTTVAETKRPATPNPMNKELLIKFLAQNGITIPPDATDDQFLAALQQIADKACAADQAQQDKKTADTALANERRERTTLLLDVAIADGRITPAQRSLWLNKLNADFANESALLTRLAPVMKTRAMTHDLGARKVEIANEQARRGKVQELVDAEMARNGGDYVKAFATVQRNNPSLFEQMKSPATL